MPRPIKVNNQNSYIGELIRTMKKKSFNRCHNHAVPVPFQHLNLPLESFVPLSRCS